MRQTYSTPLILSKENESALFAMLESVNLCWNECSKVKFGIQKNSIVDLHQGFYKKFRQNYPEIPSTLVVACEQSVLSIYRSIKSNKHKIIKPPEKKKLSLRLSKISYSYKNGIFSIISLGKRVKCQPYLYPKLKEFIGKYSFCDPLLFARDGKIYIALTFKREEIYPTELKALGIDLGCRINAATSEGRLYFDRKFNGEMRSLRYLKRCLQSKSKKSRAARKHLHKLRRKEHNKNLNFTHNLTKKIIKDTKCTVLVLENLKSIKVKKHKYQNKNRISQVPLYLFKEIFTYKALLSQKTVIQVCPKFTSQIDFTTGKKDGVRQGRRYYSQSGKIYDADVNSSNNIALRSKLPISSFTGTYGQAIVTRLNAT